VYSEKLLMMYRGTPKHVEFYSKNKFEKLVHLVGFITRTVEVVCVADMLSQILKYIFLFVMHRMM